MLFALVLSTSKPRVNKPFANQVQAGLLRHFYDLSSYTLGSQHALTLQIRHKLATILTLGFIAASSHGTLGAYLKS